MTLTGTIPCPKGHASTEADYCSECGAKMHGAASGNGAGAGQGGSAAAEICPDCGTARDNRETVFCEVCGYNFATGAHGEVPVAPPSEDNGSNALATATPAPEASVPVIEEQAPSVGRWSVVVAVDP